MIEEIEKLKEASAIMEVLYPRWLSNTVMVKKKIGKWRVCVDFTSLNQTYPKDFFSLSKIDQYSSQSWVKPWTPTLMIWWLKAKMNQTM